MIRSKKIMALPDQALFSEFSQSEMAGMWDAHDFFSQNVRMWELYEDVNFLGVFGVQNGSLLGTGVRFWFAAGKAFARTTLRGWRSLYRTFLRLTRCFSKVTTFVQDGYVKGDRLVRFFGFRQTGKIETLKVYEWQS